MVDFVLSSGTYDLDDLNKNDGRGYAELIHTFSSPTSSKLPRYVAIMQDAIVDTGRQMVTTSDTLITVGTGTIGPFTMSASLPYPLGTWVQVVSNADPSKWMVGQVTINSGGELTIDVPTSDHSDGSGSAADWAILASGVIGPTGADGADGAGGLVDLVDDLTPQLGGDLDVNGSDIVSTSSADINILPDGTGSVNLQDGELKRGKFVDWSETSPTPAISSGVLTTDLETGNTFEISLTENITSWLITNVTTSGDATAITVIFKQDGVGGRSIIFPASIKWVGGEPPTMSTGISEVDIITLITRDSGTTFYGSYLVNLS